MFPRPTTTHRRKLPASRPYRDKDLLFAGNVRLRERREVLRSARARMAVRPYAGGTSSPDLLPITAYVWDGKPGNCTEPEPPERGSVVPGLIYSDALTLAYGDSGIGKSYFALHLATAVAAGLPCLSHDMTKTPVLWIDAESDKTEFLRRAYAVARGLGLDRPPEVLYWYGLPGSLARSETLKRVREHIRELNGPLVVLDSLSVASYGADILKPDIVTEIMQSLREWGTVLALDHVPRKLPGASGHNLHPYGSVFKEHLARSVISMTPTGHGVMLAHTKNNYGPRHPTIGVDISFVGNTVSFAARAATPAEVAKADQAVPSIELTARALAASPAQAATANEISGVRNLSAKTIQNHFSRLVKEGRAQHVDGGRCQLVEATLDGGND